MLSEYVKSSYLNMGRVLVNKAWQTSISISIIENLKYTELTFYPREVSLLEICRTCGVTVVSDDVVRPLIRIREV